MNHASPSPNVNALRWIVFPDKQLHAQPWLQQARAAGFQVVLAGPRLAAADPRVLAEWAQVVRQQRLVAAIEAEPAAIAKLRMSDLDAIGPLLVVIVPGAAEDLQVWPQVRERLAQSRVAKLRFAALGVPICHLQPWQPDVLLAPIPPRVQPLACATCGARALCPGPLSGQAIAPLPDPVSNQFDLTDGAQNDALLTLKGEPPRHFSLVQAMTPMIAEAIARGQVYLDRSDKPRLDDFAADLTLLLPLAETTWQIADAQPFAAEESLLLGHLRTLQGVVVDVGAGPIRYVQELALAQAAGTLRYIAVEPDLPALERTVTVLPEALCLQGTGEHLPLRDQSVDAVLMLRSYNHLRDVPQAFREVARVLKPGGVFLACDNVTFGLCRTPEQLARAHAIPVTETPFEHYRNADAPDAAAALQAAIPHGFHVDTVQGVGPGTSNQWFLRATRL
jgi:SAM-dependent methyltransferase